MFKILKEIIIFDISNIAREGTNYYGELWKIDVAWEHFSPRYNIYAKADYSLNYRIDDHEGYIRKYIQTNKVQQASYADPLIIEVALKYNGKILSNDRFSRYKSPELYIMFPELTEEWIRAHTLPFTFRGRHLIIKSL